MKTSLLSVSLLRLLIILLFYIIKLKLYDRHFAHNIKQTTVAHDRSLWSLIYLTDRHKFHMHFNGSYNSEDVVTKRKRKKTFGYKLCTKLSRLHESIFQKTNLFSTRPYRSKSRKFSTEMNYPINAAENVLLEIRLKTPKVQVLIGTGAGLVAAIGCVMHFLCKIENWFSILWYTASIKIAESIALFLGATILILSLTTDLIYIPSINFKFDFNFLNTLIQRNGPLANGFVAGYLIGFAMLWIRLKTTNPNKTCNAWSNVFVFMIVWSIELIHVVWIVLPASWII